MYQMAEQILEHKIRYIKTESMLPLSTVALLEFRTVPTVIFFGGVFNSTI